MAPIIVAAIISGGALIISGGWTALVAITTSRQARRTNQQTIDAAVANTVRALDAVREDRIWDKRADTYVDALRVLHRTPAEREEMTQSGRFEEDAARRIGTWLASIRTPEWRDVEMRLRAYASPPVLDALRASERANSGVEHAFQNWRWMSDNADGDPDGPTASDVIAALHAVKPAIQDANRKDEALLEAIRADLHLRPSQSIALPGDAPTA